LNVPRHASGQPHLASLSTTVVADGAQRRAGRAASIHNGAAFTVPFLLFLPAALWTALDAARRGKNWFAWGVAVSVTGIALIPWLAVRRGAAVGHHPRGGRAAIALVAGLLLMIGLNLLLVANVTAFLHQIARIEGQAMSPTLNDQDRLLVEKWSYRTRDPRRGEIVVLLYPLNPAKTFVKRVVAEEGDHIRIVSGRVVLNDVPIEEPFVAADARSAEDFGPVVVPQGYGFVMGDRRNNSADSRHWGFVPKKYILGRVVYRWWPPHAVGRVR
jgi:signal peptidase I